MHRLYDFDPTKKKYMIYRTVKIKKIVMTQDQSNIICSQMVLKKTYS